MIDVLHVLLYDVDMGGQLLTIIFSTQYKITS